MKKKVFFIAAILCFVAQSAMAIISCGMLGQNYVEKNEKYCPKEKPFYGTVCGGCFGCDEKEVLEVREFSWPSFTYIRPLEDIQICENRTIIKGEYGEYYESILTECPADAPLRRDVGDCVSCNSMERVHVRNPSDCDVCPNMTFFPYEENAYYHPYERGGYCRPNMCSETHPMRDEHNCYSCDERSALAVTKEECQKCPNRQMYRGEDYELCILVNNSNKESPLVDVPPPPVIDGDCRYSALCSDLHSCDTDEEVETTKENCDKCPNRAYKDGKCVLISCGEDKIKTGAGCLACDDVVWREWSRGDEHYPVKADCDKCPNRVWDEEYHHCYLKNCPEGYFKAGKDCYPCNRNKNYPIRIPAEECAKCPERTYEDGECFIKGK